MAVNLAELTIKMPKIRIKVPGSMRAMTGAEHFVAIRRYIATATRHGTNMVDALIQATSGNPWIPAPEQYQRTYITIFRHLSSCNALILSTRQDDLFLNDELGGLPRRSRRLGCFG
ncbi:hypothetical protein ACIA5C_20100 [Actinoplanes sp. NPDC051343]|uniref:hypothetical protein n=1 Tax=Actinoplanes sp. NPDC051343 TaxID=3363906 RepID=UPI0037B50D8B